MNPSNSETYEKKENPSVETEKPKEFSIKNSHAVAAKAAEKTNSPAFQFLKKFHNEKSESSAEEVFKPALKRSDDESSTAR